MSSPIHQLLALTLSAVLFYGAFSRLTHGAYTPAFYAYQTARQPDDGSTAAMIPPVMDLTLGTALVLGTRRLRASACAFFALAQSYGLTLMLQQGKDFGPDVALLALTFAAGLTAWSS